MLCLYFSGGNWVTTYVLLAHMTVFATLLSIAAALGTMGLTGLPFVKMSCVMPFMVLGITVFMYVKN